MMVSMAFLVMPDVVMKVSKHIEEGSIYGQSRVLTRAVRSLKAGK